MSERYVGGRFLIGVLFPTLLVLAGCAGTTEKSVAVEPVPEVVKTVVQVDAVKPVDAVVVDQAQVSASLDVIQAPSVKEPSSSCKSGYCNMPGLEALTASLAAWADPMRHSMEQSLARACVTDAKPGTHP